MIEPNKIYNEDCLEGIRKIPDGTIDLIVTDPPYEFLQRGGGSFGPVRNPRSDKGRIFRNEIYNMSSGFLNELLKECLRVCKKPNMYFFCSKDQVPLLLTFAKEHDLNFDILAWHKTSPVPACNNKYLSDTEYVIFMRGHGVKMYDSYETKRKWYATPINKIDKKLYGHPTCKPVHIVQNFIFNSSMPGDTVLDLFVGSGTTAVACMNIKRNFIGFELDEDYYAIALRRIRMHACRQGNLFDENI